MCGSERQSPGEPAEELEHKIEGEDRSESSEPGAFDEAAAFDALNGQELRTTQEVYRMVAEVKAQIDRAFEQAGRDQEKFGDWVRSDPEAAAQLGRFLEFMNRLKQERV